MILAKIKKNIFIKYINNNSLIYTLLNLYFFKLIIIYPAFKSIYANDLLYIVNRYTFKTGIYKVILY